jgi:two-component system cell cycle response regulator DivK
MDSPFFLCYNGCHNVEGTKKTGRMSEKTDSVTILYVEDNRDNRMLVRRVLQAEGFHVLEAEDAPTGIEMAQATKPDLILMDINLPEIDGYEATVQLRAIEELRDVPIIALTANVMKGDRERTLAAGCSGYIQKPIDVDRLPSQLAAFLRK